MFYFGAIVGALIVVAAWVGIWYFKKRRTAIAKKAGQIIAGDN